MGLATNEKPHADDLQAVQQIGDLGYSIGDHRAALEDAYHLGRLRGVREGAEQALDRLASTTV